MVSLPVAYGGSRNGGLDLIRGLTGSAPQLAIIGHTPLGLYADGKADCVSECVCMCGGGSARERERERIVARVYSHGLTINNQLPGLLLYYT